MNKYSLTILWALIAVAASAQDKLVQLQTWYGDNMGTASEQTATKRIETFYDNQNRPVRRIQTGLSEDGENWLVTNYYFNDYDEQGNLTMSHSMQYTYDQGRYSKKASNDTIEYSYDENGRMTKENIHAKKTVNLHSYDAEGNMVKTEIYKNGVLSQTLQYRHFTKGGPKMIVSEATQSYNCYTSEIKYDSIGNKLSERRSNTDGVLTSAEYWTYEDGNLVLYEKKGISGGEEVNSQRTVYENNETSVISKSYTYSGNEWKLKGGSTCETKYANFDSSSDGVDLVSAVADALTSTVKLTITYPEIWDMIDCYMTLKIYRDGVLLERVGLSTPTFTYIDKGVENGQHEYFVQTMCNDECGNISNIKNVNIEREYPRVTGLRAVSARKSDEGSYLVKLTWNKPEITEDMQFVDLNVMKVGTYYASPLLSDEEAITDASTIEVEVNFGIDAVQKVFLQTRFEGGTTLSDTITVDAAKFIGKESTDPRAIRSVETWGDAMGNDNGITKKEVTYYGSDNRVLRVGRYSKTLGTDGKSLSDWIISEYTSYIYGDGGMLEKQYTNQYGRYDHGSMGFRAAQDTIFYEYNLEGQKIKERNKFGYTEYEYATDGSLTKEHTVEYATTDIEQTITYSDFTGKNKPQMTVSTGTRSSAQYMIETEYDVYGKKVSERKSTFKTSTQAYVPSQVQEFYYDETGELESDTVFTIKIVNGIEQYVYKSFTAYTPEEDNKNRVHVVKKVWDTILKKFGNPKTWNVWEYAEINGEKYAPTLSAEQAEEGNDVTLKVEVPESQRSAMTVLNVYRNGIEIAHGVSYFDDAYYTTDEFGENGTWTYTDKNVKNGNYDYYVECAKLNATMTDVDKYHNISNAVFVSFDTPLPCPTNLREVSRKITTTENTEEGTIETNIFVQLAWDEPQDVNKYGFERYEVMVVGSQVAENYQEKDMTLKEYELAMRGLDHMEVYVDAVYAIGRASSDTIVIEANPTIISSIKQQIAEGKAFDMKGLRISNGAKGIVIVNGKKNYIK